MGDQAFFCCFINLDRCLDRRRRMDEQLADAGIEACRMAASDGREADVRYRPRWRRWIGGQLGAGEIGCAESHRRALQRLVDSGARFGVILEDDAELAPDFRAVVEHLVFRTAGWDLVRLEQRKPDVLAWTGLRLPAGRTLVVPRNTTFGSTAMLYSARGARLALRSLERGYMHPLDAHLGSLAGPGFRFLQLSPPVVSERCEPSLIGPRADVPGGPQRSSASRVGLQRLCNRGLRLASSIVRRLTAESVARRVWALSASLQSSSSYVPTSQQTWQALGGKSLG